MIVKNEARVIARCLASVRPFVSSWVVIDTGSMDGTQALVREAMRDLPGELHDRPWRDFATNRNEALAFAEKRADYVLVVDADDLLVAPEGFSLPPLTADAYELRIDYAATSYYRTQLFRANAGFRYVGVLHEVVVGPAGVTTARLAGLTYLISNDGSRSRDPDKYKKDAAVLEAALAEDPGHGRTAFYLAQSYRDAGEPEKALAAYERRAAMGGWAEEVWYSLYQVARLSAALERPVGDVVAAHMRAYEYRPSRAEPLCYVALYLREHGRAAAAYPFARAAADIPWPEDVLFVDTSVYGWRALDELGVSGYWAGRYAEAGGACEKLLEGTSLPPEHRARVEKNLVFCREKSGGPRGVA
ncbi:MAG TPA: glycosyltransferase [Polyangiaceae bacterium]|jgi:glycosyltransferase involved in cell wall biosynthesis